MKLFIHCFILLVLILHNPIFSQSDTLKAKLDEVVVTATRTETEIREIASSISTISRSDIEKRQFVSVTDLLNSSPSIFIPRQGGIGKLSNLFLRGGNSDHTLVLIDGIKANDPTSPNNSFDFGNLLSDDIERIEILRGPQSTLYGSNAMAGVINIITRKPGKTPALDLSGEGGSNNFYRGNISARGSFSGFNYSLNYSRVKTDGISAIKSNNGSSEKDGYKTNAVSSKIGYKFSNKVIANFLYDFQIGDSDIDKGSKFGDDPNYKYKTEAQFIGANINLGLFNGWQQKLSLGKYKRIANAENQFDAADSNYSRQYTIGNRYKINWQNEISVIKNNLITAGFDYEKETASSEFVSDGAWGPYSSLFPDHFSELYGLYLQNQFKYKGDLFVTAGLRYDKHSKFGEAATFRIAPAYIIGITNTKIKATYGTGFKAPSLYNLFDPVFGNPDLKAEKSKGWDAGFEQYLFSNKLSFGFTYFSNNYDGLIGYDANYKPININRAKTEGLEFITSLNNFWGFNLSFSYTYTRAEDRSDGISEENKQLIRRPKNQSNLIINYNGLPKLNLNADIRYTGERFDNDFSNFIPNRVTLKSYTLVNFGASYKLIKQLTIFARIENLFNEKYEDVLFYGTLGRSFYAGVKLNLRLMN